MSDKYRYDITQNDKYRPIPLHRDIYRTNLSDSVKSRLPLRGLQSLITVFIEQTQLHQVCLSMLDKVVELAGGGSVINRLPVQFSHRLKERDITRII